MRLSSTRLDRQLSADSLPPGGAEAFQELRKALSRPSVVSLVSAEMDEGRSAGAAGSSE
jgi:hypothetical protein